MAHEVRTSDLKILNPPSPADAGFGKPFAAPFKVMMTINPNAAALEFPKSIQGVTSLEPSNFLSLTNVDITDFVQSFSWTDSEDEHAISASITLDNYRGTFNQIPSGTRIILQTRRPFYNFSGNTKGKFYPYLTLFVLDKTRSGDGGTQSLQYQLYDRSYWLANNPVKHRVFKADKKHPKGWTASEMIRAMAKDLGITVGTIDTTDSRVKRHEVKSNFLGELQKILRLDKSSTGRNLKYDVHMRDGTLNVVRENPTPKRVWHFTDPDTIEDGTLTESLGDNFATKLTVHSREKKFKKNSRGKKSAYFKKISVTVSSASHVKAFGVIHKTIKVKGNHTPAELKKIAENRLREAVRGERSFEFSARGVPFLFVGSRVFITSKYFGIRGMVRIKAISYNVDNGTFSMQMTVDVSQSTKLPLDLMRLYYENQGIRY